MDLGRARQHTSSIPAADTGDGPLDQFGVALNEQTDPDGDGVSVFGDTDNDNDGVPTWEDDDDLDPNVGSSSSTTSNPGGGGGDDDFHDPNDDTDDEEDEPGHNVPNPGVCCSNS